jgi:hypothetical protein
MKSVRKNKMKIALGLAVGGLFGFLLYRFIGCSTGTCPITANPWSSILYGMVIGLLMALSL